MYLSGKIHLNMNEPDKAIEQFLELEKINCQDNKFHDQSQINNLLSRCYLEKKDYNNALHFSKKAILYINEEDSVQLALYYKETGNIQ